MVYPSPVMSITEMTTKMNFPKEYMLRMAHHRLAYKYVTRTSKAKNAKILIDTAEFEKLRQRGLLR